MLAVSAARRRLPHTEPVGPPPTLAYTAEPTTLVSDGRYNSFPGVTTCPNGDILAAYRAGDSHTTGGDLYTIRSTDDGTTWGEPSLVALASGGSCYGTATLSVIDAGRIALVSWTRPNAGGIPYVDSTRIFISDDNGATWDSPLTVDTGPDWLGMHSVSESPLVYHDGAYYLGVWGVDAGEASSSYYQAGVMRSTDLGTWTRVAQFDTGTTNGFNECGVASFTGGLVCVIRHESAGRWVSTSTNGTDWDGPVQVWAGSGQGAPKLAQGTMLGYNLFPIRPASTGLRMACVNVNGEYYNLLNVATSNTYMYGQTCKITATTGGLIYAIGGFAGGTCDLFWRPFEVTPTP